MYASNCVGRKNKLEDSVVNSGEVAAARGLVLLRAESKRIYVNTGIRGTGVVLVGLDNVEVGSLTLGEAVLSVKLELSGNDGVLTPAVHVKGSLGKYECTGIRYSRSSTVGGADISGVLHLEYIIGDEGFSTRCLCYTTESVDGVGESINGISVVERLGTKGLVECLTTLKRCAVINVGIRLYYPNKLLARVVEVKLDLVGRGTNRLITSELNLLNEVLMRVLCHLAALISVKEDVINIERSSYKRLLVSSTYRDSSCTSLKLLYSPEALTNGAEINVDLYLVVLKSNKGEGKSGVAAEPELKRYIESSLRKSIAGSTYLVRSSGRSTGSRYVSKVGVSDIGKGSGVTNHLVVASLLLLGKGELVPDVHPITVLAVDALSSDLNLNLGYELLTNEVQPTGIDITRGVHVLINLRKSDLKIGAVCKITIAADCACYAASEVGLTRECLLNRLHSEVSVASVRHLPEGNLGGSSKENVLGAVGDKLHKSSSHLSVVIQ
jgi:hypothetical protein